MAQLFLHISRNISATEIALPAMMTALTATETNFPAIITALLATIQDQPCRLQITTLPATRTALLATDIAK